MEKKRLGAIYKPVVHTLGAAISLVRRANFIKIQHLYFCENIIRILIVLNEKKLNLVIERYRNLSACAFTLLNEIK